jgi:hypothetical protein
MRSCYFYITATQLRYNNSQAACQKLGGYLVAYNNATEQQLVETYFSGTGAASVYDAASHLAGLASPAFDSAARYPRYQMV